MSVPERWTVVQEVACPSREAAQEFQARSVEAAMVLGCTFNRQERRPHPFLRLVEGDDRGDAA